MRVVVILLVVVSGCVTAADVRRADSQDQKCWANYRRMVWRGGETVDDDLRVEEKRLSCFALDRKLEHLSEKHEGDSRQRVSNDREGPSGGEIAAGIFKVLGAALGGAASAGAASMPTSTTCNSTNVGGTVTTNCTSQ